MGNGSCSPTTDDSSDQASRETSTRERRHSSGSLEVLPNNSPAPSEEVLSLGPPSPSSHSQKSETSQKSERSQNSKASSARMEVNQEGHENNENNSSGIDSEIFS